MNASASSNEYAMQRFVKWNVRTAGSQAQQPNRAQHFEINSSSTAPASPASLTYTPCLTLHPTVPGSTLLANSRLIHHFQFTTRPISKLITYVSCTSRKHLTISEKNKHFCQFSPQNATRDWFDDKFFIERPGSHTIIFIFKSHLSFYSWEWWFIYLHTLRAFLF